MRPRDFSCVGYQINDDRFGIDNDLFPFAPSGFKPTPATRSSIYEYIAAIINPDFRNQLNRRLNTVYPIMLLSVCGPM